MVNKNITIFRLPYPYGKSQVYFPTDLLLVAGRLKKEGMDWTEVGKTRLAALVGNTIVGRPYGIYRDWVMKKLHVKEDSHWLKKYVVDVGTFATGATPFYLCFLAVAGADASEMTKAASFLTLAAPLVGRPQGWVYDKMREQFGLETAYEKNSKEES